MKRLTPETEAKEPDERDGIEVMRQWSRDDDAELKALCFPNRKKMPLERERCLVLLRQAPFLPG